MSLKALINGETHFEDFFAQIEDNQEAVATTKPVHHQTHPTHCIQLSL